MANDFVIKITAVDRATKTVEKVNNAVGKIFQPYENAKKSTRSFFDALGKNDLVAKPIWALNKLGTGAASVATSFGIAETSVLGSTARMAASIASIGGPFGAVAAGALVVAGATTAVGVKMAKMGFDVDRTAKNLGMTTERLQEYRGAAKLAGIESQTMDSALGGLSGRLVDIAANRDLQGATLLQWMRISLRRTKDGAIDTATALRDISNVIARVPNAQQQLKIADMLGIGDLLPLLRQGGAEIDKLIKKAHQQGLVMSQEAVDQNKKQADAWNETKGAIDGVGISIGNLIAKYAYFDRLARNSTDMASGIKEWADKRAQQKQVDNRNAPSFTSATVGFKYFGHVGATVGGLYDMFTGMNQLIFGKPQWAGAGRGFVNNLPKEASKVDAGFLPRGLRNNNPGNLNFARQPGAVMETGPKARFAVFPTPEQGLTAMAKNLVAYQEKYGINTIEKIINRWAPPSENNTGAYVGRVSRDTGLKADAPLNLKDPATLAPLISSIIKHENGQNPYDADTIARAAAAAVRESQGGGGEGAGERPIRIVVEGLPPGTRVQAVRGLGQPAVGLTMQPGGTS